MTGGHLVIPAAGWGRKNHWRDPRLFEGVAAECLNTADLVAYVQSMGFSTSSSTSTRQQYLKIIVDGLRRLSHSEGYALRERGSKRKSSPEQSETSKSQRPRVDKDMEGASSDADPDVEMSDHEDSKVEEEEAEADESSVMSEGVNWMLETPAYKIAVKCPIVAAMQDLQRADEYLDEAAPNLFWDWVWFRRYILGVPQRCVEGMECCHMVELDRGNPAWVKSFTTNCRTWTRRLRGESNSWSILTGFDSWCSAMTSSQSSEVQVENWGSLFDAQ